MSCSLPDTASLKEAIAANTASKASYEGLSRVLSRIGRCYGGTPVFSTVVDPANDGFLAKLQQLTCIAGAGERLNNANLVLITNDSEPCVYAISLPRVSRCAVFYVHMQIRCTVDDRAFIEIGDGSGGVVERLLIGNEGVCLTQVTKSFKVPAGDTQYFFTIVVSEATVRVYFNGDLRFLNDRKESLEVRELRFGLLGKPGSTLEASLLNLDVWQCDEELVKLTADEGEESLRSIAKMVDVEDLEGAIRLLAERPLTLGRDMERSILALVERELRGTQSGYRDWLFEKARSALSEEGAAELDALCERYRPEPDLIVKNICVEFLENPAERFSVRRLLMRQENRVLKILNDVTFTAYPGDRVGIIGQNGVGKSTLLRTLIGLIPIERGEIRMLGEYMLLKAGVGMRNELTGRENIYHAGAYLGLWGEELDRVVDSIVEFSELGPAIDRYYKFYSDGMKARLVFSLATSVNPDILLLDELLSAGDISFKKKAEERLEEFLGNIRLLLLVTHGISFVRNKCNKALFLAKNGSYFFGDPEEAISLYLKELAISEDSVGEYSVTLDANPDGLA